MPYIQPDLGNEVVISGIAGRYPSCRNVAELKEKIMDKQELIAPTTRWPTGFSNMSNRIGEMMNVEKFDSLFFGINSKQVSTMDPLSRILLEHTYEAIVDAGCNHAELRGKNIAVAIGVCQSESETLMLSENGEAETRGYSITGCSKAMMANRISYWLGVHGPSFAVDTACSSSATALDLCYEMIINGNCDAAIVGGANLLLHPTITMHFARLGVLSQDGHCRPFDAAANGYVRSDALCVIFLQRAKDAKRIYATVVHSKMNNDGYKREGITFPSSRVQAELLSKFYDECKIPPSSLNYLEAHGTGTRVGDPEEISAVDAVLCKGRTTPLRIGSVKSNLGHSEPVSGLCAVSKVIIAMETGIIPPSINYNRPNDSLTAVIEGRLEVVTEKTPWELGYAAVNSFGFGGSNVHVLLKSNPKEKVNNGAPNDDLARVVVVSGRTEAAVNALLDSVENVGFDAEYIRLLHDVYTYNIPKHPYRGYTMVGPKHTTIKAREVIPYTEVIRPVCFIFSGMGSQWPGMGKMLMRYPVFAEAIKKCEAVLKPRGIDIVHIISTNEQTIFNNILNCFIGIAAVQIGLVDLLTAAGIMPDNIIGHSVGELGCAYADGCFTAEQMILAAYARGLASIETEFIDGAMAAIGLGAEQVKKMCPADIDVACHNSETSSTISGPSGSIRKFVADLAEKKVFAKEVATSNIAYHSRYIAKAGPKLLTYLREIIPEPKARSEKWLSSSVPQKYWSTEATKYSSAEYHTNNLLSAVLFEETAKHIPENAITIEIAPHGLLQAILRRSLGSKTTNVPLTLRGHRDNAEFLAQALGKLYNVGLQPNVANIYPPVSFPVSRGTPMISPNIKWDHSDDLFVAYLDDKNKIASGERTLDISIKDSAFEFMSGHVIDGRNLLPATGYIWLVWETLALMKSVEPTTLSVVFEDTRFHRATTLSSDGVRKKLTVMINKGTGYFEILEQDAAVATGKVRIATNPASEMANTRFLPQLSANEDLDRQDIYKELKIRGYEYQGLFQSVKSAACDGTNGHVTWHDNYVAFLDNMLQFKILGTKKRSLCVPTCIRKLIIDVKAHQEMAESMQDDKKDFPVYSYKHLDLVVSGGVQIFGMIGRAIPRRNLDGIPVLEEYKFVAHRDRGQVSVEEMIIMSCDFALDVLPIVHFKSLEVVDAPSDTAPEDLVSPVLLRILKDVPLVQPIVYLSASKNKYHDAPLSSEIQIIEPNNLPGNESVFLAVGQNLLAKGKEPVLKQQILPSLRADGFIMTTEDLISDITLQQASDSSLDIIIEKCNGSKTVLLLRKHQKKPEKFEVVSVTSKGLDWVEKVKEVIKSIAEKEDKRLILVTQADRECGILGMVNCLRKEPGGEIVRAMIIEDENSPTFSPNHPLYAQQLQLDLPINILKAGAWGSYRHLPLPPQKLKSTYHTYVNQLVHGDLSSLRWTEGPVKPTDSPEDQIHTVYMALNFKDIMVATGRIAEEATIQRQNTTGTHSLLGFEYSGLKANGERVMGLASMLGISNLYNPKTCLTWKIKDHWSLEDAATVPAVYATACYALYMVDNIKKGEKILIHSGTGGVGQAAIHLALQEGLEVFTTVGTPDKRRFIREKFPSIPDDHIDNSRDTSFEYMIMERTNGRGVDIVLNSLTEDKLLASVRCLAAGGGRFLEIGKYDIAANNALNMLVFLKEISFRSIMLDTILADNSGKRALALKAKLQDFLDRDRIQPICRKVFDKEEVESAFRYMSSGKHIGKVLIKICDENGPYNEPILSHPRFYCTKSGSYVIVGGLGGLGLEVAEWLCSRGARNLILISRRGITTGYQKNKIRQWRADGINVKVIMDRNCWERKDCEYVLMAAAKLGPVDAIFNLAVQLKDALFTNQSVESFEESLRPKVGITKQLDQLSRTLCPELRYFVVFSSVACGRGNAGQTNYGYGNAVMERICERRVAEGLPGLAIQWGAVGEVGIVANMQKDNKTINIAGTLQQKVSSCMQEMERFLLQSHPVVCSMVAAEKRRAPGAAENPLQSVLQLMGMKNADSVNKEMPLIELGMDSILGVEIKETLQRDFDIFLAAAEIRTLNFQRLIELSDVKNSDKRERKTVETTAPAESDIDVFWGTTDLIAALTIGMRSTSICVDFPAASDESGASLFLIPGISGFCDVFTSVVRNLKYSATCLQFPQSDEYKTVNSLADYFLPHITAKLSGVPNMIILVGYSFGTLVTIEIAKRLEVRGHKLRIIFIEGAPLMLSLANPYAKLSSESHAHSKVLLSIAEKYFPSVALQCASSFEKLKGLNEKVNFFLSKLDVQSIPVEYQKEIYMGICTRVYASIVYEFDESLPLKSPITFLKATKGVSKLANGYHGLEKVTKGVVEELTIAGDHATVLKNDEVATIINSSLVNI